MGRMEKMGKMSGKSEVIAQSSHPVEILFIKPARTPWWAKGLTYAHVALRIGPLVYEQPLKGPAIVSRWEEWSAVFRPLRWQIDHVTPMEAGAGMAFAAGVGLGRKSQPIRTALYYLGLWPKPPWNCLTAVTTALLYFGETFAARSPDELLAELEA
jgi:hypothetical protein